MSRSYRPGMVPAIHSLKVALPSQVDIVFEEDKGFWAAIQTFIETTKRPIILTSTIDQFIAAESERLTLAVPSLVSDHKLSEKISGSQLPCGMAWWLLDDWVNLERVGLVLHWQ